MQLPADIVFHWLDYDPTKEALWHTWLSMEEVGRLRTFGSKKRQQSFVQGRAALRLLLAGPLKIPPPDVRVHVASDNALEVPEAGLHISLAHAGDVAVAAMGGRPLGIDIEQIKPRHPDLHRFLLHPMEYPILETLPLDRSSALILCWALKEATLKAMRTGFRVSPKKLRLAIDWPAQSATVQVEEAQCWQVKFKEKAGYWLAVAY